MSLSALFTELYHALPAELRVGVAHHGAVLARQPAEHHAAWAAGAQATLAALPLDMLREPQRYGPDMVQVVVTGLACLLVAGLLEQPATHDVG